MPSLAGRQVKDPTSRKAVGRHGSRPGARGARIQMDAM
jgi:hypothetical protein